MANRWGNDVNSERFYFGGLQNHCRWWLEQWNEKTLTPWKKNYEQPQSVQFSSVAQSCPTLCDPMNHSTLGLLVHHQLQEFTQTHIHRVGDAIQSVMPSSHLILCRPLLLLPSILSSIRVFPRESVLRIRWPKYCSFSFSISPSNEYSRLISFRMDWMDLLAVQGTQESSPTPQFKSINSLVLSFLHSPTLTSLRDYWKNPSFD